MFELLPGKGQIAREDVLEALLRNDELPVESAVRGTYRANEEEWDMRHTIVTPQEGIKAGWSGKNRKKYPECYDAGFCLCGAREVVSLCRKTLCKLIRRRALSSKQHRADIDSCSMVLEVEVRKARTVGDREDDDGAAAASHGSCGGSGVLLGGAPASLAAAADQEYCSEGRSVVAGGGESLPPQGPAEAEYFAELKPKVLR